MSLAESPGVLVRKERHYCATDVNVTMTFEHVCDPKTSEKCLYAKEWGKSVAVVMHLAKKARIEGSGCVIIVDSWFASIACACTMHKKMGLHLLGLVKTGTMAYPKEELIEKVKGKECGAWATATMEEDGEKYLAVVWKGKSKKMTGKKKKHNWYQTFITTDCTTTLEGTPAEKKRHDEDGNRAPLKMVPRPRPWKTIMQECLPWTLSTSIPSFSLAWRLLLELLTSRKGWQLLLLGLGWQMPGAWHESGHQTTPKSPCWNSAAKQFLEDSFHHLMPFLARCLAPFPLTVTEPLTPMPTLCIGFLMQICTGSRNVSSASRKEGSHKLHTIALSVA
jgi:hypothetical protein